MRPTSWRARERWQVYVRLAGETLYHLATTDRTLGPERDRSMTTHDWLVRIHADRYICTVRKAATGDGYAASVNQSGSVRWTDDYSTIEQATLATDAQLVELGHHCSAGCQGWAKASHDE